MDPFVSELLNLIFRWTHLAAGIFWIGHLYFFNFVNAQLVKTYDADTKKKVVPELMPRALYFFRWGAMYTWISGVLLLGIVYHMGGVLIDPDKGQSMGVASAVGLGIVLFGFFVYDLLWKSPLAKNEQAAVAVSLVLLAGVTFLFSQIMTGRAAYIHVGGLLGTIMFQNVWMRIWPSQKKIIAGIKGTAAAPDASVAALAGLRSKHNTYMSIPLTFLMVSNHFPSIYGHDLGWLFLMVFVAVGMGAAKFLYVKSASAATAAF